MEKGRDYSPKGRSMSISPDYQKDSPNYRYRSRSKSRSPHYRRHHKKSHHDDYDSDREYRREHSDERSRSRSPYDHGGGGGGGGRGERSSGRHHHRRSRAATDDHGGGRSRRRSRSSSRWERRSSPDDRKSRGDRYKDDDSDSERSTNGGSGGAVIGASGSEIIGYKSQPPNKTIMIRGLAQHITENDIRQNIIQCGLMPRDIRLIRKKDTGASRGFAFVEFGSLGEAIHWMNMKQGVLMLQDQYRAIMQYSIPKDGAAAEKPPVHKTSTDWFCIKCGAQNFKRRLNCFKCHASRTESEEGGSGSDEICTYATKTIMMRNLDALTTEDSVMTVLNSVMPQLVKSVSAVCIGRDPLTSTSRGICYLGTESTIDALAIHGALSNLPHPLSIDGKTVILSYCKYNMGDTKKAYSQDDNAAFPNASVPSTYAMADVGSLAEYAARRYAKSPDEYVSYIDYYRNYFTQQISAGHSITLHQQDNQMDSANAAAAVAQSAIQQMYATKTYFDSTHMSVPTGTDGKRYPVPDVAKYTYDKQTGYQYDASTGLYYDPNSNYYWNSVIQKYLYWDQDKMTYVLAPSYDNYGNAGGGGAPPPQPSSSAAGGEPAEPQADLKRGGKPEKHDKVKVAKKIAKDMERWAKTLNQKKETATSRSSYEGGFANSSASADIGFAVLEKKSISTTGSAVAAAAAAAAAAVMPTSPGAEEEEAGGSASAPLVAAYGGESESSGDEDDEADLLDYNKLICNLCKRQLGSAEALTKHAKLSSLHQQNLDARRKQKRADGREKREIVYRDRAKERRMKYGDPDEPSPSKLKEKYLKAREVDVPAAAPSVSEPIGSENVGNRLLQKMGWTEGQGLGRQNQGRTTIIQVEPQNSTVGLGNKQQGYTAMAGESYKDCVKKLMYARYQELTERENNS